MAAELMGGGGVRRDLEHALRVVLRVTLVTEGVGALLLTALFAQAGDSFGQALWRGVFTAVSAFCNAGFALQSDSLMGYADRPLVLLVVGAVIVVGGLGPPVVAALPTLLRGRGTAQARVVLWATVLLLVGPAALFLALEWDNTLAGMGLVDKVANAAFQSVTLRTAGFNSIDFGAILPATWTLALFCMFVGGSPGSTAGGVKTTTMAVLVLAVLAAVRGRTEASAFRRRIPHRTVYEATAITTAGTLSAVATLAAVQLTQDIPLDRALFEVVSALGTVGLSMGATAQLDDVGKIVIMLAMFAGRVGPLTLFIFFLGQERTGHRYPLESLQVG
jgi:trk system potassium uptake protein TrkH